MIVFDDADLEAAAEKIAECGYFNAGAEDAPSLMEGALRSGLRAARALLPAGPG